MAGLAPDLDAPGTILSGQVDQVWALWQPHGPLTQADEEVEGSEQGALTQLPSLSI